MRMLNRCGMRLRITSVWLISSLIWFVVVESLALTLTGSGWSREAYRGHSTGILKLGLFWIFKNSSTRQIILNYVSLWLMVTLRSLMANGQSILEQSLEQQYCHMKLMSYQDSTSRLFCWRGLSDQIFL